MGRSRRSERIMITHSQHSPQRHRQGGHQTRAGDRNALELRRAVWRRTMAPRSKTFILALFLAGSFGDLALTAPSTAAPDPQSQRVKWVTPFMGAQSGSNPSTSG